MTGTKVNQAASDSAGGERVPARSSSRRRAQQAETTRRDILMAARRRFAATGYAATTLRDIAAEAGVSVQTVYDSVGAKAQLVRSLNDLIDGEAGVAALASTLGRETEPARVVRIPAQITRRLVERCGDILRAALAGSFAEPELGPLVEEGQRRHRAGSEAVARRLGALGALRPGMTVRAAATTIAALSDFRLALILTGEQGLSADRLEQWIAETTARAVMEPQSGDSPPPPGSH